MKSEKTIDRDSFIEELTSMTPDEINELIIANGKGPKVVQLVCRMESGIENNTEATNS